jgi:hypothetical protein
MFGGVHALLYIIMLFSNSLTIFSKQQGENESKKDDVSILMKSNEMLVDSLAILTLLCIHPSCQPFILNSVLYQPDKTTNILDNNSRNHDLSSKSSQIELLPNLISNNNNQSSSYSLFVDLLAEEKELAVTSNCTDLFTSKSNVNARKNNLNDFNSPLHPLDKSCSPFTPFMITSQSSSNYTSSSLRKSSNIFDNNNESSNDEFQDNSLLHPPNTPSEPFDFLEDRGLYLTSNPSFCELSGLYLILNYLQNLFLRIKYSLEIHFSRNFTTSLILWK